MSDQPNPDEIKDLAFKALATLVAGMLEPSSLEWLKANGWTVYDALVTMSEQVVLPDSVPEEVGRDLAMCVIICTAPDDERVVTTRSYHDPKDMNFDDLTPPVVLENLTDDHPLWGDYKRGVEDRMREDGMEPDLTFYECEGFLACQTPQAPGQVLMFGDHMDSRVLFFIGSSLLGWDKALDFKAELHVFQGMDVLMASAEVRIPGPPWRPPTRDFRDLRRRSRSDRDYHPGWKRGGKK